MDNLGFLIGNAVFFKGRWKHPFNISSTSLDQFKDEDDKILNEVAMMTQRTVLPYGYNAKLESQIVEIPYAVRIGNNQKSIIQKKKKKKRFTGYSRLICEWKQNKLNHCFDTTLKC